MPAKWVGDLRAWEDRVRSTRLYELAGAKRLDPDLVLQVQAYGLGKSDLITDLEALATHWAQLRGSEADARAIRDAVRMVGEGWTCDIPSHVGICFPHRKLLNE